MALKCRNFSRLVLIFTNVLFLVLGGLLIMIGGYMMSSPDLNEFTSDTISGAIIASGFLIVLVAALGCCGAHWESKVFLCPYATLVTVSIMSQLALAAFMLQLHKSLIKLSNLDYNVQHELLTTEDTTVLTELHNVFKHAYSSCAPEVDLTKTFETGAMVARCMGEDASYNWFADFVSQRCMITAADLMPNSPFQKCAGEAIVQNVTILAEQALFCSCETKLVTWMDKQSEMIGVVVAAIGGFEIALVFLSCYLMCTQRRRSKGYQEIRMPLKMQHNNANVYHTMSAPYQQHNVQGTAMYAPVPNTDSRIKP
ncbi:hypothetical protein H310_04321 [Aphanomyces invadans]|uniref:Tetraspanin n=1 Tax=Aphanomyces invadans TaxID=157072 RepID=A0A024UBZ5_9STRA|nr:hypothetical protein H310_04321 [Aphanomyces invadans]ETW03896.1 hypothetical protein H310_04321 [Aphanomyces invadans]|eukprot:XP_008866852.1 hypothetical protein H310_04321 [Aphanomyces invadans]